MFSKVLSVIAFVKLIPLVSAADSLEPQAETTEGTAEFLQGEVAVLCQRFGGVNNTIKFLQEQNLELHWNLEKKCDEVADLQKENKLLNERLNRSAREKGALVGEWNAKNRESTKLGQALHSTIKRCVEAERELSIVKSQNSSDHRSIATRKRTSRQNIKTNGIQDEESTSSETGRPTKRHK